MLQYIWRKLNNVAWQNFFLNKKSTIDIYQELARVYGILRVGNWNGKFKMSTKK